MDWSYSNLEKLFEVGREAGQIVLFGDGKTRAPCRRLLDYEEVFGSDLPKCA